MGCSTSRISKKELQNIQVKTKGKVAEKDIVFWHKLWLKITPSGKMSRDQFVDFFVQNNIGTGSTSDAASMFKIMDGDKSGFVEFDEFVMILALPRTHEEMNPEDFASLCIAIYDENEDGVISEEELVRFAITKAKRENRLDEEFEATVKDVISRLVQSIDVDGDGTLTQEEIVKAIRSDPELKRILFAGLYTDAELMLDPIFQQDYIMNVATYEHFFHQDGVGINFKAGLTYDGHPLNFSTGELDLAAGVHFFSAASKESLHINMLTLCLVGNEPACAFVDNVTENQIKTTIQVLENKITSYEKFNKQYPGFGGYLPWFNVTDEGLTPNDGWLDTVPGLDNGQLAWAIYALVPQLQALGYDDLASRWQTQLERMKNNSILIFYDGGGRIRSVTKIKNVHLPPSENTYTTEVPFFLDDPYEGELFAFFMDIFGNWQNISEREKIWILKRRQLQSVNYYSEQGNITVQRGFWYSAHEQWKLLVLPYYSVDIANRVFTNCERARTVNSMEKGVPGLYASVNDVSKTNPPPDYLSAVGIPSIAFEPISRFDVITPYGSMPVFLADLGIGLVWYNNMLQGPRMQGPYGSTESVNVNGTLICPLTTWDSKITSLLAMLGGISPITQELMTQDGTYERFAYVVNREYSRVFQDIQGEDIPFGLPNTEIPLDNLGYFPTCSDE